MPKIDKPKKNLSVVAKTTPKKTKKTKSRRVKSSPVDYYNCLLVKAQNDWRDSTTGQRKKITVCCQDCKTNAPKLQAVREQEITKLITSYHQVGVSLKKLLKPIK